MTDDDKKYFIKIEGRDMFLDDALEVARKKDEERKRYFEQILAEMAERDEEKRREWEQRMAELRAKEEVDRAYYDGILAEIASRKEFITIPKETFDYIEPKDNKYIKIEPRDDGKKFLK